MSVTFTGGSFCVTAKTRKTKTDFAAKRRKRHGFADNDIAFVSCASCDSLRLNFSFKRQRLLPQRGARSEQLA
jgi:hypothetical protein